MTLTYICMEVYQAAAQQLPALIDTLVFFFLDCLQIAAMAANNHATPAAGTCMHMHQ